ncbi:Ger(x)C family spore germination protein [Cytobacillus sp. FJAT-54145]|uniref:Ger(X)C family spore germination protein n=1 Tax=Cytobacillus spartinae TaxID=3299023 RepID=A0ABW6KGL1_9BACI
MGANQKTKLTVILVICILSLTGCWSRNELTELAIVTGMAIDKKGDEYLLTIQVVNPGELAGKSTTSRAPVTTYEATGKSIFQAIRRLSKVSAKRLYFSHLRLVVISEEQAKAGISKLLDLMSRDHEFRTDFYTVVSRDERASNVLKILTAIEQNPAEKIFNSIDVSHSFWAPTLGVKLVKLIGEIISEGDNPVLTGILIQGDKEKGNRLSTVEQIEPNAYILIDHFAVFKKDKLVGWLDEDESKGHNYITDNVESTVAVVDWDEGNITFEIRNTETNLDAVMEGGKPKILVNVTTEAQVGEVQAKVDLMSEDTLTRLEEELSKNKEDKMTKAVQKAKKLESDIFGFGEVIHRKDPKLWGKLKENWNEDGFLQLEVEFKVESQIRRLGTINDSFLNEVEGGS